MAGLAALEHVVAEAAASLDDVAFVALFAHLYRLDGARVAAVLEGRSGTSALPESAAAALVAALSGRPGVPVDVRTVAAADGRPAVTAACPKPDPLPVTDPAVALDLLVRCRTQRERSALDAEAAAEVAVAYVAGDLLAFSDRVVGALGALNWLAPAETGGSYHRDRSVRLLADIVAGPVFAAADGDVAAVLGAAAVMHARALHAETDVVVPLGALVDAAAALGEQWASDVIPDPALDVFDMWGAVAATLFERTGDASAAAACFGTGDLGAVDDICIEVCCRWWYPLTERGGPPVPLDGFLDAATRSGARHREVYHEMLAFTSPALPVQVAAAFAGDDSFGSDVGCAFVHAAAGLFGHRWAPDDVVAAVAANPTLSADVDVVLPGMLHVDPALDVPGELIAASMARLGLGHWCAMAPGPLIAAVRAAADAAGGLDADGWAVLWSLLAEFFGTPTELVDVVQSTLGAVPAPR